MSISGSSINIRLLNKKVDKPQLCLYKTLCTRLLTRAVNGYSRVVPGS